MRRLHVVLKWKRTRRYDEAWPWRHSSTKKCTRYGGQNAATATALAGLHSRGAAQRRHGAPCGTVATAAAACCSSPSTPAATCRGCRMAARRWHRRSDQAAQDYVDIAARVAVIGPPLEVQPRIAALPGYAQEVVLDLPGVRGCCVEVPAHKVMPVCAILLVAPRPA